MGSIRVESFPQNKGYLILGSLYLGYYMRVGPLFSEISHSQPPKQSPFPGNERFAGGPRGRGCKIFLFLLLDSFELEV